MKNFKMTEGLSLPNSPECQRLLQYWRDINQKRIEFDSTYTNLKAFLNPMEFSLRHDKRIAEASHHFCEQVPEGVISLPERQEIYLLPVECVMQVKAWSQISFECYISKKKSANQNKGGLPPISGVQRLYGSWR